MCSAKLSLLLTLTFLISSCFCGYEFIGYRMGQYDLQGVSYGSAQSVVSFDLRTMRSPILQAKCIVAKSRELANTNFKHLRDNGAGCLLILLPSHWPNLTNSEKEYVREIEEELFADRWQMPIYFAVDSPRLTEIYAHAEAISSANHQSANGQSPGYSHWFSDGYHLVTPFKAEKAMQNYVVGNVKGSLSGLGAEDSLPTIIVAAHYDASGSSPSLSFGYDANGSGVVALLELARIFSRFYSTSKTHPKYNIQFLLSGAGKYNYLGSKYWIDALPETVHASSGVGQSGVQFVLCLDTLVSGLNAGSLFAHVSKPPKDDSTLDVFFKHLQSAIGRISSVDPPQLVHKKINLAASKLAWEHERFSIRRLPAMTLSVLQSSNSRLRETISDLPPREASPTTDIPLCNNIRAIGEALARYIYDIDVAKNASETTSDYSLLNAPSVELSCEHVHSLRTWLSRIQRAAPLLPIPTTTTSRTQSSANVQTSYLSTLHTYLATWLPNAQITTHAMDKKEPELVFYENLEVKLSAFVVKPAIYDLFLACGVASWLGLIYLVVWKFPVVYSRFSRLVLFLSPGSRNSTKLKGQ